MIWVEIFRSHRRTDCEQRSFVLYALGIAAEIQAEVQAEEECFALLVPEEAAVQARAHLADSEAEARRVEPVAPPLRVHEYAWVGCVGYALVLISVAYCEAQFLFERDWQTLGVLRGTVPRSGEWWRSVTALMLHADTGHLFANLCFGMLFGFFAGQMLGTGLAWAGTLVAATLGNVIDIALSPTQQVSLGASTAVFATLGLLSAYSWRKHSNARAKWAFRGAPLVAGIALLAMTGSGSGAQNDNTDVLAHLSGFVAGVAVGLAYALSALPDRIGRQTQLLSGMATLLCLVGAWWLALR
jgi:membrane associated rhomboid family serine protease